MAKTRAQIITDSDGRYLTTPGNITPQKHKDSDSDIANAMEHILEGAKLVAAADANSDQLFFDWSKGYVHGSNALPLSGDLTINLTGALGLSGVVVFHNDSTEPSISGAIKKGYNYIANVNNILIFLNINGYVTVSTLVGAGEPYATNVAYDNPSPQSNDPITLTYNYNGGGLEGTTLFQHYEETGVGTGIYQAIPGATLAAYTPTAGQVGLRLKGEVTVVSQTAPFTGQPVQTPPTDPVAQGAFLPTDIASLITWANLREVSSVTYSGSPEEIDQIDDYSGNTNFWVPSYLPDKPLYDLVNNWAEFAGTNESLRVSSTKDLGIAANASRTMFVVFSGTNPGPTEMYGLYINDGLNNKYTLHHKTNGLGIRNTGTTFYYFAAQAGLLFDGNLHVLGIRQDTTSILKLQLDAFTETDSTNKPFAFALNTPFWGRNALDYQGEIREILFFDEYLDDTDFNNVFTYLQTQNGL